MVLVIGLGKSLWSGSRLRSMKRARFVDLCPSDEIMYDARMHPEQYSNTLSATQVSQLHKSIHYVCGLAVETLADSNKFPEEWLFKHRWAKGKKNAVTTLPNGSNLIYLTVGGRTSAVVPSVQKKTGRVKKDVDADGQLDVVNGEEEKPKGAVKQGGKRKKAPVAEDEVSGEEDGIKPAVNKIKKTKGKASTEKKLKTGETRKGLKSTAQPQPTVKPIQSQQRKNARATPIKEDTPGQRRSGRSSSAKAS